ncbi:MAG: hypothetical protein ACI9FJ_002813 [Alteromonadaceae bacterium]
MGIYDLKQCQVIIRHFLNYFFSAVSYPVI